MGSGIYSLGTSAMFAAQAMLDTTAHNISNANTPGYSRQQVELATEGGLYTGSGFFGRGVRVATVTRSTNEFLVKEANLNTAAAASDQTRLDKLSQLENVIPTGENGLGYASSQLLNAFVDVANQPQDVSARQVVLSRAQEWVSRVNTAGNQIEELQAGVVSDMGHTIDQINGYTKQIASLNQDIAKYTGVGHTANDLLDQRDLLVNKLNKLVQVNTVEAEDGSLSVFMGGGQLLVLSNQAQTLALVRDPSDASKGRVALVTNGTSRILDNDQIVGGALEGLQQFQDEDLEKTRSNLNTFVAQFSEKVNKQQTVGWYANPNQPSTGLSGPQIFNGKLQSDGTERFLAASISLSSIKPNQIATASPYVVALGARDPFTTVVQNKNKGTADISSMTMLHASLPSGVTPPVTVQFYEDSSYASGLRYEIYSDGASTPYWKAGWTPGQPITDGDPAPAVDTASFQMLLTGVPKGEELSSDGIYSGDSITISTTSYPASNNGNALAMLALRDNAFMTLDGGLTNATITDTYSQMIGDLGVLVQNGKTAAGISSTLETQATQTLASTSGVNLDEEASRLIQYQQSYQAAAKVLQVAQKVFETLLNTTA